MFTAFAAAAVMIGLLGPALGDDMKIDDMAKVGDVMIHGAWARASLGNTKNSAAYMTLEVTGDAPDRLIATETEAADRAELHNHLMADGIAKMRPVAAVEVAPGEPTVLQPGGLHVMLMGVKQPLVEGETMKLSLTFEQAGSVDLELPIKGVAGGMRHGQGQHGHDQPATN